MSNITQAQADALVAAYLNGRERYEPIQCYMFAVRGMKSCACGVGAILAGLGMDAEYMGMDTSFQSSVPFTQGATRRALDTMGIDPTIEVKNHDGNWVHLYYALSSVYDSTNMTEEKYLDWLRSLPTQEEI